MATNDKKEHKIDRTQHMKGKVCLFFSYLFTIMLLMIFFAFTPFTAYDGKRLDGSEVDGVGWRRACDNYDVRVLDAWGLS